MKTRTNVATEQEKILQQRENEIASLRAELNNYSKLNSEVADLKNRNEEKELTIKSNEQSRFYFILTLYKCLMCITYPLFSVISYLNKQLNDLQLRSENTVKNPPWFSTPNEGNGIGPKIPMSTLRSSPLQLGQTLENR